MVTPKCCGLDAVWRDISPSIGYWFCTECRKEVDNQLEIPKQEEINKWSYLKVKKNPEYNSPATFFEIYKSANDSEFYCDSLSLICSTNYKPEYIPQEQVDAAIEDLKLTLCAFYLCPEDAYKLNEEVVLGYHNNGSKWYI